MHRKVILSIITVFLSGMSVYSQNPIVQTYFTADPAPMIYNDTVYVYTSHDEDRTKSNFFTMYDWRCYSTADMVNWTDHGAVASFKSFKWLEKDNGAWAPQCIERNGKFYLYVPIHGTGVCVLVSNSPYGPFTDPLGKQLVDSDHLWQDIDPTVFVDDDGQAYLYWGNPSVWYVKLNEDMISYDKSIGDNGIVSVEMTKGSFGEGVRSDGKPGTKYVEGPWFYKRNNLYYLLYAVNGIPESIGYSTSHSPTGPWEYRGLIMERHPKLAFTNHSGVIDFKGNSYFFYHNEALPNGGGFRRSTCVEQFEYNEDASIPSILPTVEGIKTGVAYLNPFKRNEAETIAWSEGVKTKGDSKNGVYVSLINNGDYIKLRSVDFAKGAIKMEAIAASITGGKIEIRLDTKDGQLIGVCEIENSGSVDSWKTFTTMVEKVEGIHDLYFVFKGKKGELFNFDAWQFSE